jgi:hypothetical protein
MSEKNIEIVSYAVSTAPPLDFSFKSINDLRELVRLDPRSGRRTVIPEEVEEETKDVHVGAGLVPQTSGRISEDE